MSGERRHGNREEIGMRMRWRGRRMRGRVRGGRDRGEQVEMKKRTF